MRDFFTDCGTWGIMEGDCLERKPFLRLGVAIRRFFCSKILGHKIDLGYTDNGYMVCKRCKMHEYYDANFDSPALFLILKRVKW